MKLFLSCLLGEIGGTPVAEEDKGFDFSELVGFVKICADEIDFAVPNNSTSSLFFCGEMKGELVCADRCAGVGVIDRDGPLIEVDDMDLFGGTGGVGLMSGDGGDGGVRSTELSVGKDGRALL